MKPRYCIVSDLDHTMVDHHDTQFTSLLAFNRLWTSKFAHDSLLVFSTGRSLELYKQLRTEAPMLTPDLLICSVGTEIYHTTEQGLELDDEWLAELEKGWDRPQITSIVSSFVEFTPQSGSEQRPHKVSYYLDPKEGELGAAVVDRLRTQLADAHISCKVIHSGGRDVDVLPACASKGLALQFLQVCRLSMHARAYRGLSARPSRLLRPLGYALCCGVLLHCNVIHVDHPCLACMWGAVCSKWCPTVPFRRVRLATICGHAEP